jgi:tetratricopeptide (TPR) repeat protein
VIRKLTRTTALGLGALLLASASVVSAQYPAERPADRLSRYLHELASDPTSLSALIGAGQAALDVGDGNAALGFFARADERSPRNGHVKAGLARALLMVDNPREALKMFDAARSLGVAEIDIAGDRGLAYDLRGDQRRAQHDYALALTRGPNDEISKRYALSLGISGERDQALKLIDPLLYKKDQGAWRARAFVLAMTGDVPGASRIVHQVMPERMAQTMDPFLIKLAALNAAQKAAAVHLGEMPSDVRFAASQPVVQSTAQPSYYAPAPAVAPTPPPATDTRSPRRRPDATALLASPPPTKVVRVKGKPVPAPTPTPTPPPAPPPPPPIQVAQFDDPAAYAPRPLPSPTPAGSLKPAERGDLDAIMRDIRTAAAKGGPVRSPAPVKLAQAAPRPTPTPTPRATPVPKKDEPAAKADPKKGKAAAADEDCAPAPAKKGKRAAVKTACEPVKGKAAREAAAKKKAEPKNPARIWVQVAGGANENALPKEWTRITAKATELKGKGPWTAKNRATNRLLAGPYKSDDEAQAAVAKLRKAGIGAFQWHSDEGEAVEKIGGK